MMIFNTQCGLLTSSSPKLEHDIVYTKHNSNAVLSSLLTVPENCPQLSTALLLCSVYKISCSNLRDDDVNNPQQ